MLVYLASPCNHIQCSALSGMSVLLSFGSYRNVCDQYQSTFDRILIDSGAYGALTSGKEVDLEEYIAWSERWEGHADAVAGLDDISGDWKKSLRNYKAFPKGFPTFHDTDPSELLDDLIPMARERGSWLGLGLKPPREGKEKWVREACSRIPDDIHVHGWALRRYTHVRRLDSVDSTNWLRDVMRLRTLPDTKHLTETECLEIIIKRYQRWQRVVVDKKTKASFGV
jgi:hypothetical protein